MRPNPNATQMIHADSDKTPHRQHATHRSSLAVRQIMSTDPVTACPNASICATARKMLENGVSCIVVTEGSMICGILTQTDILSGITDADDDIWHLVSFARYIPFDPISHPAPPVMDGTTDVATAQLPDR